MKTRPKKEKKKGRLLRSADSGIFVIPDTAAIGSRSGAFTGSTTVLFRQRMIVADVPVRVPGGLRNRVGLWEGDLGQWNLGDLVRPAGRGP